MHHSANTVEHESDSVIQRRQRIGLLLLLIFSIAYGGFIGLCTFAYQWISQTRVSGIPLTVAYGVGLVFFSLVIAMVYGLLCRDK